MVKKRGKAFRTLCVLAAVLLFLCAAIGVLQLGAVTNLAKTPWYPSYEKENILPLLQKSERTEEEYRTLQRQTGLTKLGIDGLLQIGAVGKIQDIQAYYFKRQETKRNKIAPFSYMETVEKGAQFAALENGDILLTPSVFVSWFRYGHSALVVNAAKGEILEAYEPGSTSSVSFLSTLRYAAFIIVRPKTEKAVREAAAEFARESLLDIPYSLTAGIFGKKFDETGLKKTQCTHIVWYAYRKFGVDIDGNGGKIVKPPDILLSREVEIVQIYGVDPDELWR